MSFSAAPGPLWIYRARAHSDFLLQLSAGLVTYPEAPVLLRAPEVPEAMVSSKHCVFERVALWLSLLEGNCGLTQ